MEQYLSPEINSGLITHPPPYLENVKLNDYIAFLLNCGKCKGMALTSMTFISLLNYVVHTHSGLPADESLHCHSRTNGAHNWRLLEDGGGE